MIYVSAKTEREFRPLASLYYAIVIASLTFGLSLSSITEASAQSFIPSPQQIEQFKNLPRAQQEALARQMGFDISILDSVNSSERANQLDNESQLEIVERKVDEDKISSELARQSIVEDESKELKPFGYSLFDSEKSSFEPITNIPVPSDYIIGAGDNLILKLFGKETGNFDLFVNNEGSVDLPELGPVNVLGMTFQEVKRVIEGQYEQQKIGVQPFLSMGKLRTIQVFLVGEVFKPGSLTLNSLSTLSTALFNGGGVSELGSLRNIKLKRAGKTIANFDLYDLMLRGDVSQDVRLQQGDVVFVPLVSELVSIDGQVRRPAIYEIKQGESLKDLLVLAGGLLPTADSTALQLVRNSPETGLSIKTIDSSTNQVNRLSLQAGDFVKVQEATLEFVDAIRVRGSINSPRLVSISQRPDLSSLISKKTLLKNTDLNYAIIIRKSKFEEYSEVLQFKPSDVLNGGYDLALQPFDELVFFSRTTTEGSSDKGIDSEKENSSNLDSYSVDIFNSELVMEDSHTSFTQNDISNDADSKSNSRKELLAPIIARLKSEADERKPVALAEITGQVRYPGVYPIASNKPTLISLIDAAGGLTEAAHLELAEISKFGVKDGKAVIEHIAVNLLNQLSKNESYKLESKDVVKIAKVPDWFESNTVILEGEFVFPGAYQISKGETLSSVIQRAGGITSKATPSAAVFMREELKAREQANLDQAVSDLRQQIASSNLSNSQFSRVVDYENASKILDELIDVEPVGRLIIDLPSILDKNVNVDIELKDGDRLVLPSITPSISVIGEVFVPTTHRYFIDYTIDEYIKLSGGMREYGDESKVYIVRADGSVFAPEQSFWFSSTSSSNALLPGDTIVVPREVTNYESISLWSGVTQIIYQTAVALAAIGSL